MFEKFETIDLLEGIATARSIHRYRFDPIPDEDLAKMLYATQLTYDLISWQLPITLKKPKNEKMWF